MYLRCRNNSPRLGLNGPLETFAFERRRWGYAARVGQDLGRGARGAATPSRARAYPEAPTPAALHSALTSCRPSSPPSFFGWSPVMALLLKTGVPGGVTAATPLVKSHPVRADARDQIH